MTDPWRYEPARDLALPPAERRRSLRREVGLAGAATCLAWRWLTLNYLALVHRLEIEGRAHLPARAPFVMVANHSSHLDAITLARAVPFRHAGRIFPIAAGDTFFTKPLTSVFATACMNALPISRKSCGAHSLEELRERLVRDEVIYILFPEGTRSRTGEMASFKPGVGRLVCGSPVPVVPCYLEGAWSALPPGRRLPHPSKLRLRIGEPLSFESATNDREGWEAAARATEAAVRALGRGLGS
jgi:1-acyl-sn-glycerol-3-phosphate acyltransferase